MKRDAIKDTETFCKYTDRRLWKMSRGEWDKSALLFPTRDDKIRVSEQEARFSFEDIFNMGEKTHKLEDIRNGQGFNGWKAFK